MSLFITPINSEGGCCSCERAVDACTCCPFSLGDGEFSEFTGYDCTSGPPCGDEDPTCGGATIGPITIYSTINFKTKCLEKFKVKVYVNYIADNYGSVAGANGSVICPLNNSDCNFCYRDGTIDAYTEEINETESRAYVIAIVTNAPHGGGYGMEVGASFYLDEI
jgi:hypothetical protein